MPHTGHLPLPTAIMSIHFYEPQAGHRLPHDPFNAIVAPRPIGWISTLSEDGVLNLAPYSFFNGFNYKPPIVGFSSLGEKDSLINARATGDSQLILPRSRSASSTPTSFTVCSVPSSCA